MTVLTVCKNSLYVKIIVITLHVLWYSSCTFRIIIYIQKYVNKNFKSAAVFDCGCFHHFINGSIDKKIHLQYN